MRTLNYPNFDLQQDAWQHVLLQAINNVTLENLIGSVSAAHVDYYDDMGRGFKIMLMKAYCSCPEDCYVGPLVLSEQHFCRNPQGAFLQDCGGCAICIHQGRSNQSDFSRARWVVQPSLIEYTGAGSRSVQQGSTGILIGLGFPLMPRWTWKNNLEELFNRAKELESSHEGPPWTL